ncbi:recombination-associated protein RdgC [Vibrio owensii]|uniref:recombination-associated protein RdgC n=1 Tax=Vibrio owensii TaxID=696485 RepID=UPI0023EA6C2F|nr:recombination-associated protein RdgC [Vibrio owensii]
MIFTEASVYRLFEFKLSLDALNEKLGKQAFKPMSDEGTYSGGFINPKHEGSDTHALQLGRYFGFAYRMAEKKVSPAKVAELVNKRLKALEEKGTPITQQLKSDIQEGAKRELLRFEVPKMSVVTGYIDAQNHWLYLNSKSGSKCEDVISALRKALGSFRVMPASTHLSPSKVLCETLCVEDKKLANGLKIDLEGKFKAVGEKAHQKVGFDGICLDNNEIAVLKGKDIIEADLYFDKAIGEDDVQRWSFKLHTKKGIQPYQLSKINHVPLSEDDYAYGQGDDDTIFEADWLMTADVLSTLSTALYDSFGGFVDFEDREPAQEEADEMPDNVVALMGAGMPSQPEQASSLYAQAVTFVREEQRASVSMLQRKYKIGYNRAEELIERMEIAGVVSAPNHNGLREVLNKEDQ